MSTETRGRDDSLLASIDGYRVALYATLGLLVAFFLAPIEAGLVTSFKTTGAVTGTAPYAPPIWPFTEFPADGATLAKYQRAFDTLTVGVFNSLLYAVPATILSALIGSLTAYGLTLVDWKYQVPVLMLFVAGVFIPYQAVLVPLSQVFNVLSLGQLPIWGLLGIPSEYAGIIELIIAHVAYGLPICTILFRSYYQSMSTEMLESARLDGATLRRIYRRIVFPLSTPMFAVVLIYQFTQIWNDLLFALILVSSASSPAAPVTLKLAGLGASLEGVDFGLRMAGAFVAALPTLVVYIAFGEEFAEGVAT
ncbi:carbohydrate ABC transporter permease [Halorarum halobium]|uniref:carbohydrate ABC transporter permease n=1 Tax=Halorarum halobium TaxID=3075121 RepID=UPI0028A9CCA9|nr:carbohydrate ABC transporter permease [Halobaculum sp. XH14]